jgi:hypothetical protein
MSKTPEQSSPNAPHWEPKFPFDLVVAYQDTDTRDRALHLYDSIAQKLLDDYDFQCAWWRFEHLQTAALMQQATDAAIEANMIILSVHAGKDLPPIARAWIDRWSANKAHNKSALVTLIDLAEPRTAETGQLQAYLQQVARRARMDFFFHAFDLPQERQLYTVDTLIERAETVTPLLQEILKHRPPAPPLRLN